MRLKTIAASAVLLGASTALGTASSASPAAAQPAGCGNDLNGQTCEAGAGRPGTEVTIDLSAEVGPRVSSAPKRCISGNPGGHWVDYGPPFPEDFLPVEQPPTPESRYWVFLCPNHINGIQNEVNWEGGGWGGVNQPPETPPTAQDVLPPLWDLVKARLENPAVALDPVAGGDSIINVPTFVEITNPQPSTTYTATATNSAGSVDVWIAVLPTYALHPGEPEARAIPCDEDGTAWDPGGAGPRAQADAADGCVYTYTKRSADGWPGDVTITWQVTWGSSEAGQNGNLDAAPNVGGFDRVVEEVQDVMTRAGG